MKIIILLLFVLFGIFRGIKEGIVMSRFGDPNHNSNHLIGARGHIWFRYYHFITWFIFALYTFLVLIIYESWNNLSLLFIAGIVILLWEVTEIGYAISRYNTPIPGNENIDLMDEFDGMDKIYIEGWLVKTLHIGRIVIAGILLLN